MVDFDHFLIKIIRMELQQDQNKTVDYDTVAVALLNAFSKGQTEDERDNSLAIFLTKLFKNNSIAKSKRMNSIRLSRFNAFLFRVNNPFPDDPTAVKVIHASLLAMLGNERNFSEEEDQEMIMSIAQWTCEVLENSVKKGFTDEVTNSLKFLLSDQGIGQVVLPTVTAFEQLIKGCPYLNTIQLNAEDETRAYNQPMNFHLTDSFSLKGFILEKIQLKHFYRQLFKQSGNRAEVMTMFNSHIKSVAFLQSKAELFVQTFINDVVLASQHMPLILKMVDELGLGVDGVRTTLTRLLQLGVGLEHVLKLELKGTSTEEIMLQLLKEMYSNRICQVVDAFLMHPVSNMIAPYLFANADQAIPANYATLPLDGQFTQRHLVVASFAIVQNSSDRLYIDLVQAWSQKQCAPEQLKVRNSYAVKALYLSLCHIDKNAAKAKIASGLSLATINAEANIDSIPTASIAPEKLSFQHKPRLSRLLSDSKVNESCVPLKIELLGLCGQNMEMTKRISNLQTLFQHPVEFILKDVCKHEINLDKMLMTALLMGLNNRMEVTFIEQPDEKSLTHLARLYLELDKTFGRRLGQLIGEKESSPVSHYLQCLLRYNIHTKSNLGNYGEPLNSLLKGSHKYNRVVETDFSAYFYKEETSTDLQSQLWQYKKLLVEMRKIIRKLLRKEKSNLAEKYKQLRDVQTLLNSESDHVFSAQLIQTYFNAQVKDPEVLRHVLAKLVPSFSFFQRVSNTFCVQEKDYIEILSYLPNLLVEVYPEALAFMAKLIDSQSGKQKEKDKKKGKNKKPKDVNPIQDVPALFEEFQRGNSYPTIFGDPTELQTFDEFFRIFVKIPKEDTDFQGLLQSWLERVCIFHPQKDQQGKWRVRVLSYCHIWNIIFLELGYKLRIEVLKRHFDILAELLNIHYQSKFVSEDIQEQLLLTLLLIMQGGQPTVQSEGQHEPLEQLKNCLLGFKLPTITEQHYFTCNTCELSVCQVCAPFLHKHHDLTYTGKDGSCIHDANQSQKRTQTIAERVGYPHDLRREQKRETGLDSLARQNIFAGQPRPRREEDLFALNFDLGADQQMDYNEHIRFRELMEYRLQEQRERERDMQIRDRVERRDVQVRERDRDRSRSRDQDIFLKFKDDLVEEKQEAIENDSMQIRSESSKSICNLQKGHKSGFMFTPQFSPIDRKSRLYTSPIDARPLRNILMRQLLNSTNSQTEQGKSKIDVQKERYNFFKQSSYFRNNRNDYGGLMRGINPNMTKRNLLTSNQKFLAFPSSSNGILLLSLQVMGMKMQRRQANKSMSDYEQERTYITNAINNSNLAFEPFQLIFGKNSLLAVVGMAQLGFFVLNSEGKVQRFMESDIKCAQMISKFQWISRQKSNVFALSYGNTIRLGNVAEDLRIRTGSRLKIQIDKTIRDFEIQLQNHNVFCFVIDTDGALYRADFDIREARSINMAEKKINLEGVSDLQSMLFFNKKIAVSSSTGKLHLLKNEHRTGQLVILQSYDLQQLLRTNTNCNLKGPVQMINPKMIQTNENVTSIACLLSRGGNSNDSKKRTGAMAVLRFSGLSNDLDILLLNDEETVEHFDVFELSDHNYAVSVVEQNGTVWLSPYSISTELLRQKEESKLPLTEEAVQAANKTIRLQKLLYLVKSTEPKRYDTYKDTKQITSAYTITTEGNYRVSLKANSPCKYFITGVTISLEVSGKGSAVVNLWGEQRVYQFQKNRDIQIGFNLKESLQSFVQEDGVSQFVLTLLAQNCTFGPRAIKIHGVDFNEDSVYHAAYAQLHRLVTIYYLYDDKNVMHYLQNPQKSWLPSTNLSELQKLKLNHKYSHKELVLLMKLQLLRVSTSKDTKTEDVQEMLQYTRLDLLPQCQRRQFLEKSCWKLIKQLCQILAPNGVTVGHPFEFRTILDFYRFERCYKIWNNARTLGSFQRLVSFLYSLIFKRISNLYLVMHMSPTLIYELTMFYKNFLHTMKQSGQPQEQQQLSQLINLCPAFVALVCQYYQIIKNSNQNKMVDEKDEGQCEKSVLDLLEEVFCATKKQLYREIFVSPEIYLDRLYLAKKEPITLKSSVNIFELPLQEGEIGDHASRKASACQQDPVDSEESQLEIEEESLKEMEEEEAREMPESLQVSSSLPEPSDLSSGVSSNNLKKLSNILSSYILPEGKKINFVYHQFCFSMLTALFKYDGLITKQNGVFYLGFAFNLVRIIEFNVSENRDKEYLNELFKNILRNLQTPSKSILYLVLNYFFEPVFKVKEGNSEREMSGSNTKLASSFLNYLNEQKVDIEQLMLGLTFSKTSEPITMTKAMKLFNFEIENQIYQLRFVGNVFVLLKSNSHKQLIEPSKKVKDFVLSTVVKHRLRIFRNIMIWMKWTHELDQAKIQVGFETLKEDKDRGIDLLFSCANESRQVFISKLAKSNGYIAQLEDLLGQQGVKENSILQMLNIYYGSD